MSGWMVVSGWMAMSGWMAVRRVEVALLEGVASHRPRLTARYLSASRLRSSSFRLARRLCLWV